MAVHKPLVLIGGKIARLPEGDRLSTDAAVVEMECDVSTGIVRGNVVYASEAFKVKLADADSADAAEVLGLADAAAAQGAYVHIQKEGVFVLEDWTAVTGTATLVAGTEYYLDATAGKLTSASPATGYLVYVGRAIDYRYFSAKRYPILTIFSVRKPPHPLLRVLLSVV